MDEKMRLIRWVVGVLILAAVVALLIVFWPRIMEAGQRFLSRRKSKELDDLGEASA
jgi:hypothetical protein